MLYGILVVFPSPWNPMGSRLLYPLSYLVSTSILELTLSLVPTTSMNCIKYFTLKFVYNNAYFKGVASCGVYFDDKFK